MTKTMEEDSPWVYGTQVLEDGQEIHFKLRSIWGKTNYLSDATQDSMVVRKVTNPDGETEFIPVVGYIE